MTSVSRTLFDLAAVSSRHQVEKAFNEADVRGLTDGLSVPTLIKRHPGHKGNITLRTVLGDAAMRGVTQNDFEDRFAALIERCGLPQPRFNADIAAGGRFFEADCLWDAQRVIVELDGRGSHGTALAFENDRERDRLLMVAGWRVMRLTWRQLRDDAPSVVADLRRLLRG